MPAVQWLSAQRNASGAIFAQDLTKKYAKYLMLKLLKNRMSRLRPIVRE